MAKSTKNHKRIHATVSGRVHGVGFRYFAQKSARLLKLTGDVRNVGDGRVEVNAEGDESALLQFIRQLERGPCLSHVLSVEVRWMKAFGSFNSFDIAY